MISPSPAGTPARFSHSTSFPELLARLPASLLVSTYQAGQLCSFGTHDGALTVQLRPYPMAMGIAVHPRRVSVGAKGMIWTLENTGMAIARQMPPAGAYQAALLPRTAHVTGSIHCHEMAYCGEELWVVNTLFSCLATIEPHYNFVPRWKPSFVSDCHQPGDRCHLNGMAVVDGRVRYVTALAQTDTPAGWRTNKHETGVVIDVSSGEIVTHGLAMPHSPRVHGGQLFVLDSGRGELVTVDPANGKRTKVAEFPGYARGLSFLGPYAFVGLSRIRETSVFGGLPIAERKQDLKCGIGVVDVRSGGHVATFQFLDAVEEIFAVEVIPTVTAVAIAAPPRGNADDPDVWIVPPRQ